MEPRKLHASAKAYAVVESISLESAEERPGVFRLIVDGVRTGVEITLRDFNLTREYFGQAGHELQLNLLAQRFETPEMEMD